MSDKGLGEGRGVKGVVGGEVLMEGGHTVVVRDKLLLSYEP